MRYQTDPLFSKDRISGTRKAMDMHHHTTYELYFLLDGTVTYLVDGQLFYLQAGDVLLIPPNLPHSNDSESCLHNERLLLSFDERHILPDTQALIDRLCTVKHLRLAREKRPLIEEMFYKIENEADKNHADCEHLLRLYFGELTVYLNRFAAVPQDDGQTIDPLIRRVVEFVFEQYAGELSLKTLSDRFHVSPCYLSRRFKNQTGTGLNHYILAVRLARAKDLLKQPFTSVTDVAARCGFGDSNYFSDLFKKATGTTPLRYAKAHRDGRN